MALKRKGVNTHGAFENSSYFFDENSKKRLDFLF